MTESPINWVLPDWTASRADVQEKTYLLALGLFVSPLAVGIGSYYASINRTVPFPVSLAVILVYLLVIPGLAIRERTEILFDGLRLSIRIMVFGFLLFASTYWLTKETSAFDNLPMMVAFTLTASGLYATTILGITWIIQYARKGTTGVEPENL